MGKAKDSIRQGSDNPFDDPYFWLSLATIDFCGLFGKTQKNSQPQSIDKENGMSSKETKNMRY
ncbi:hypothetical protein LQZ19_10400 [Treponema primitia]|uniref:hypothetical protein n=1 Tax=Treponema primitia TaxID=88058 RepID=UPI00397F8C2A